MRIILTTIPKFLICGIQNSKWLSNFFFLKKLLNIQFENNYMYITTKSYIYCSECNTALSKVRYQDDIYTEHNMKTVCRAAVAQWKGAPDSQWINASSNLERRIFLILHYRSPLILVQSGLSPYLLTKTALIEPKQLTKIPPISY